MVSRVFVELQDFTRQWAALGLNDADLHELQKRLLTNPEAGPVIQHTGGARKIRVAFAGRGQRSSGRVIYVDIEVSNKIYFIMAYPKNKQESLTPNQEYYIGKMIDLLKGE